MFHAYKAILYYNIVYSYSLFENSLSLINEKIYYQNFCCRIFLYPIKEYNFFTMLFANNYFTFPIRTNDNNIRFIILNQIS